MHTMTQGLDPHSCHRVTVVELAGTLERKHSAKRFDAPETLHTGVFSELRLEVNPASLVRAAARADVFGSDL